MLCETSCFKQNASKLLWMSACFCSKWVWHDPEPLHLEFRNHHRTLPTRQFFRDKTSDTHVHSDSRWPIGWMDKSDLSKDWGGAQRHWNLQKPFNPWRLKKKQWIHKLPLPGISKNIIQPPKKQRVSGSWVQIVKIRINTHKTPPTWQAVRRWKESVLSLVARNKRLRPTYMLYKCDICVQYNCEHKKVHKFTHDIFL